MFKHLTVCQFDFLYNKLLLQRGRRRQQEEEREEENVTEPESPPAFFGKPIYMYIYIAV